MSNTNAMYRQWDLSWGRDGKGFSISMQALIARQCATNRISFILLCKFVQLLSPFIQQSHANFCLKIPSSDETLAYSATIKVVKHERPFIEHSVNVWFSFRIVLRSLSVQDITCIVCLYNTGRLVRSFYSPSVGMLEM